MDIGFFSMNDVQYLDRCSNLTIAREAMMERVTAHPNARPDNTRKAVKMIMSAQSVKQLMFGISNWVLAHPSEGLKVKK